MPTTLKCGDGGSRAIVAKLALCVFQENTGLDCHYLLSEVFTGSIHTCDFYHPACNPVHGVYRLWYPPRLWLCHVRVCVSIHFYLFLLDNVPWAPVLPFRLYVFAPFTLSQSA